ncbi:hypothetical protein SSPIM334S_07910 [Streptomyces spiroverticillatus]|uniref:hypothetical protein n=1 Tax=Streptomyces finlayi TaxID=67296 RepID=UPI001675B062|nr:hypothetical protein [Streptomyces finlayi]
MPGNEAAAPVSSFPDEVRASAFREFRAEWLVLDGRVDVAGFLKPESPVAAPGIAGVTVYVTVHFSDASTRTCTSRTGAGNGVFACEVPVTDATDAPVPVRATAVWPGSREFSRAAVTKDVQTVVPDAVEDGGGTAV